MRYESAVSLKTALLSEGVGTHAAVARSLPGAAMAFASAAVVEPPTTRPFALGITGLRNNYRLAVRVQRLTPGVEQAVESVRIKARGECDVRLVGRVAKQQPWHRRKNRPLRIGGSVGHVKITAGTLGCFVRKTKVEEYLVLSNNHVLANENDAASGDTILQQGRLDGGRASTEKIGELEKFVRLKNRNNLVDAATASLNDGMEFFYNWIENLGPISGIRQGRWTKASLFSS
jgi:hypothetical protein